MVNGFLVSGVPVPIPRAIGEPTPKCPHGYWEHSQFNRCPWCHGRDQHNARAVPVRGPGNGWLLKEGDPVCVGCGGPGGAGWGLLPSGAETWTPEQHREYRQQQTLCYGCICGGLQQPIRELNRTEGVREVQSGSEVYWQCLRCWRWARPRWAHACGPHPNWHATVRELEEAANPAPPTCLACGGPQHEHECQIQVAAPLPFQPGHEPF